MSFAGLRADVPQRKVLFRINPNKNNIITLFLSPKRPACGNYKLIETHYLLSMITTSGALAVAAVCIINC
jgi:hypothetical protein